MQRGSVHDTHPLTHPASATLCQVICGMEVAELDGCPRMVSMAGTTGGGWVGCGKVGRCMHGPQCASRGACSYPSILAHRPPPHRHIHTSLPTQLHAPTRPSLRHTGPHLWRHVHLWSEGSPCGTTLPAAPAGGSCQGRHRHRGQGDCCRLKSETAQDEAAWHECPHCAQEAASLTTLH